MPRKPSSKIPRFKSEQAERSYWQKQDSAEVIDWAAARRVTLANLKPSTATISLRLPEAMLAELKLLANQNDVPYQSLLKMFLAERLDQERQRRQRAG